MITDAVYEEALTIITDMLDELGELDPSVEGYIDLMEFAIAEIEVSLSAARADIVDQFDEE